MATEPPLQDRYAPQSICFGCGPANPKGLRIKSRRFDGGLRTYFTPEAHHQAFSGIVNGGILGTLVDCHGNWTAAVALLDERGVAELPSTVTARFEVRLRRPTPYGAQLMLTSHIERLDDESGQVEVAVEVTAGDVLTVTGWGLFVAVEEGHPAFHRWN